MIIKCLSCTETEPAPTKPCKDLVSCISKFGNLALSACEKGLEELPKI